MPYLRTFTPESGHLTIRTLSKCMAFSKQPEMVLLHVYYTGPCGATNDTSLYVILLVLTTQEDGYLHVLVHPSMYM